MVTKNPKKRTSPKPNPGPSGSSEPEKGDGSSRPAGGVLPEEVVQALERGVLLEGRVSSIETELVAIRRGIESFVPVVERVLPLLEGAGAGAPPAGAPPEGAAQEPTSPPGTAAPNMAAGPIPAQGVQPGQGVSALLQGAEIVARLMEASKPAPSPPPPGAELAPALSVLGDLFKVVTQLRKVFLEEFKIAHKAGLLEEAAKE